MLECQFKPEKLILIRYQFDVETKKSDIVPFEIKTMKYVVGLIRG
jgi:hypothetical protein